MTASPAPVYDPAHYDILAAVEDRHFWFRARNEVIRSVAAQFGLGPGARILELGCGSGNALRALQAACPGASVIGVDRYLEGLRHAQHRTHAPLVCADGGNLPLRGGFDLVCLFDVLEHIDDDLAALRSVRSLLKPGGHAFLTVPAHMKLWSYFDELSCHRRRYERAELCRSLEEAGFQVEYATEFMSAIYPLVSIGRRLRGERGHGGAAEFRVYPILNGLLRGALWPERLLICRHRRLPRGTSILAVASAR